MHGRGQRGGVKVVAEPPGDAWSGAGAGAGLGRRGNGGAAAAAERKQRKEKGGILGSYLQLQELQELHCKTKLPTILKLK
jgi:hypothetical protein